MKSFVVIGLGRFGTAVAEELYALGHEVLAIDRKEGCACRYCYSRCRESCTYLHIDPCAATVISTSEQSKLQLHNLIKSRLQTENHGNVQLLNVVDGQQLAPPAPFHFRH